MTLKVRKIQNAYWVYNPIGGRGRWCVKQSDGVVIDREKGMYYEPSPKAYQRAVDQFIKGKK